MILHNEPNSFEKTNQSVNAMQSVQERFAQHSIPFHSDLNILFPLSLYPLLPSSCLLFSFFKPNKQLYISHTQSHKVTYHPKVSLSLEYT